MRLEYLVDTDWVIHYLNGRSHIVARLDGLKAAGLALSVISLALRHDLTLLTGNLRHFEAVEGLRIGG